MLVEKSWKNQFFNWHLGENVTCNRKTINRTYEDGDWNFACYTAHRIGSTVYHINIPKSFPYLLIMAFTWICKIVFFSWRKKGDRSVTFNWICNGKIKQISFVELTELVIHWKKKGELKVIKLMKLGAASVRIFCNRPLHLKNCWCEQS